MLYTCILCNIQHYIHDISLQKPKSRHEELKERARMLLEEARKDAAGKRMVTPGSGPPDGRTASTGSTSSAGDSCSITETVTTKHSADVNTSEVGVCVRG